MSRGATRIASAALALTIAAAGEAHDRSQQLAAIPASRLRVTAGRAEQLGTHTLQVSDPGMRAIVVGDASRTAELSFRYEGPSRDSAPLANGELRRQIGLALRAQDTCNVVYVMWHVEPTPGIFVSVKSNPGSSTHEQCGANGYLNLEPRAGAQVPPITAGAPHRLRVALAGDVLRVTADERLAWEGTLPAAAFAFDGAVGVRSDNGRFEFELRLPPFR